MKIKLWSALGLALILAVPAVQGQNSNSGDIRGLVTDASGAVIPDTTITVLDLEKGVTKTFTTNGDGIYDTGPLVTGQYKITFSHPGFSTFVRSSLTLNVQTVAVDAQLKPGEVTQEVVVTTDVPLIKTESGEQSTILDAREMQARPNVGQDWQNFVKFLPGASGAASYSGATGQALSINGNLPYNAVLNDGASSSLSHSGNADVSVFETVQEVQVNTSAFSAQYGIGGASFNQISKGGSNTWHGSLYDYTQNEAFDARSYFNRCCTTHKYHKFDNYGGAVSGPVMRNKLFFYFNFDKTVSLSSSTGYITVPTAAMRTGDFSALAPIYDPSTTTVVGGKTQRTQFTNNQLTHFDPAALNVQKLLPLPNANVPGTTTTNAAGVVTNNYAYGVRGSNPFNKYFGRFDYDVNPKNRITGSVTKRDNPALVVGSLPCPINCELGDVDSYNAQLTDVWNISPRMINEARFGYTNQLNFYTPQTLGKGVGTQFGIPSLKADLLPSFNITSYVGISPSTNAIYKEHNYDPSDIVTMIRGQHVLHFGGEYLIFQDNSTAWGNINAGTFGFTGTYTACGNCASPGGNGYADFLLGNVQNWSAQVTPEFAGRQKAPQMFAQDDWKIKPNLTINIGLRYQIMEGWSDGKGNQRTFDPMVTNSATGTLGAMWFANNKDHGRTQIQNNVYDTFLPRVGFAYQWRPGTVLRGGYGMYAYLWSLDTFGSGEGSAFGSQGSQSDASNGATPIGILSTTTTYPYVTASTSNSAFNGQGVSYNPQTTPTSKIHQYNISLEKQIGANMSATLAYVGSRSVNLVFSRDINQVPLSRIAAAKSGGNITAQRPYPQYQGITGNVYDGDANYNSMQATFNRRLAHSVGFQMSYVWSKFLDEFDSSAWGSRNGTTTYQNANAPGQNYGPSNFDVRHAFKGTATYQLPFGRGQMFMNKNAIADEVVGGWQLAANFSLQTGNPLTVTVPTGSTLGINNYLGSGNIYPVFLANANSPKNRSINHWYNTSYINNSTTTAPKQSVDSGVCGAGAGSTCNPGGDSTPAFRIPEDATLGNVARNSIYGPGYEQLDLSLGKTFNLYKDRYKFQLRIDATNALNHPVFGLPGTSLSSGNAGQITSTIVGGRVMQLGGRFSF
ncbi:MAG TPA: TonB-dependent receptor [Acidobacteriaceae bacterium]|jgi:hypothetical protein